MSYYYIGTPYSHIDPHVRAQRALEVNKFTTDLLREGIHCYSPITHCHELAITYDLPRDIDFWQSYNFAMIKQSKGLIIFAQDEWKTSKGLLTEIAHAKKLDLPVATTSPSSRGASAENFINSMISSEQYTMLSFQFTESMLRKRF